MQDAAADRNPMRQPLLAMSRAPFPNGTLPDCGGPPSVVSAAAVVHITANIMVAASVSTATAEECAMDELNGRMIACQILITGLIARVANNSPDPLRFLTDFRDEIRAVVKGVNIAGMENTDRVRQVAQQSIDELFSLMKPPSSD
jgi:hypothetical protein